MRIKIGRENHSMKKLLALLMGPLMLMTAFMSIGAPSYAKESEMVKMYVINETIEYFEDGSYMTITIAEMVEADRELRYEKKGYGNIIVHNKNGDELWRFTVYGTFSVNPGVSATCTAASCSYSIADNAWQNESASAYCSGNQAIGDATFIRKLLGITVESKDCHVVLTCDENGNLS